MSTAIALSAVAVLAAACQSGGVAAQGTTALTPTPTSSMSSTPEAVLPLMTTIPTFAPNAPSQASPSTTSPLNPSPGTANRPLPPGSLVPVIDHIKTTDKVVFLTIDDGWVKEPDFAAYVKAQHIPLTMFLTNDAIKHDYAFFKDLQAAGSVVENHTLTHAQLTKKTAPRVKKEICSTADKYTTVFGQRPLLFRPPYGAYDATTRLMAAQCGVKALVQWNASMPSSTLYLVGSALKPGDIILLHFHKHGVRDMKKLQVKLRQAGLTPALLTNYIK